MAANGEDVSMMSITDRPVIMVNSGQLVKLSFVLSV